MRWQDIPEASLDTLKARIETNRYTTEQFLHTIHRTSYTLQDVRVVVTSTRPRNGCARLRAYLVEHPEHTTQGEPYWILHPEDILLCLKREAHTLTERKGPANEE